MSWESFNRISASSTALFVKLEGGAAHGTANGKNKPRTVAISTPAYDGIAVANCTLAMTLSSNVSVGSMKTEDVCAEDMVGV